MSCEDAEIFKTRKGDTSFLPVITNKIQYMEQLHETKCKELDKDLAQVFGMET